jgi:hypothetical protein
MSAGVIDGRAAMTSDPSAIGVNARSPHKIDF